MVRLFEVNEDETGSPIQREFEIGEDELELPRFTIDGEISRRYTRFNAVGTQLTVRLLPPAKGEDSNPVPFYDQCE
jgi:hypothetical protein